MAPVPRRSRKSRPLSAVVEAIRVNSAMLDVLIAIGRKLSARRGRSESTARPMINGRSNVKTSGIAMPTALTEASATTSGTTNGM